MKLPPSLTYVLFALSLISTGTHAEVWKCKEGDRVVFSDSPCPKTGAPIDNRKLQGNVVQAQPVYPESPGGPEYETDNAGRVIRRSERELNSVPYNGPVGNTCPSENDIRNMQVKANSNTLGRQQKQFMYDEIRRARQCAAGQGNYGARDWQASREAQNAQSSIAGGRKERINAEGVHSAADPIEGDRIAALRAQEAAARAYAEAERRRVAEENARRDVNSRISSCDSRGCFTTGGTYYQRDGGGNLIGPSGLCKRVGDIVRCG